MATGVKNNLSSSIADMKLTNDCIIEDVHTTITHQEIVNQWHSKVCKKIKSKLIVCFNEELFDDVVKEYLRLLKEQASNFKDKKLLKEKVLKHLHVFHLYYCSSDQVVINTQNYLDSIETILLIICNLEYEIARQIKKNHFNNKEYNRIVKRTSQKMIEYLSVYLKCEERRIIHVLLKFDYKYNSQIWKDIMHMVYRHYLINLPVTDYSDEGFCRYYLLFQKFKNITQKPMHAGIDKIMYFRFKKNPDCIKSSPVLKSILLPSANSIADLVDVLADKNQAAINTYFRHLERKLNDIEAISLDSDEEDSSTFELREKRRNGFIKSEKGSKTSNEKVASSKTNPIYVIDDDDDDDSNDIEIIDSDDDHSNLPSLPSAPIKTTTFLESIHLPSDNTSEDLETLSTTFDSSINLDTTCPEIQSEVVIDTPSSSTTSLLTEYLKYMHGSKPSSDTSDSTHPSPVSIDCERTPSESDDFDRQLEVILNTCESNDGTGSSISVENEVTVTSESENISKEASCLINEEVQKNSSLQSTLETNSKEEETHENITIINNTLLFKKNTDLEPHKSEISRPQGSSKSKLKSVQDDKVTEEERPFTAVTNANASSEVVEKNKIITGLFKKKLSSTVKDLKTDSSVTKHNKITSLDEENKIVARLTESVERVPEVIKNRKVSIDLDVLFGNNRNDKPSPTIEDNVRVTSKGFESNNKSTVTREVKKNNKMESLHKEKEKERLGALLGINKKNVTSTEKINRVNSVVIEQNEKVKSINKIFGAVAELNHFDSLVEESETEGEDEKGASTTVFEVNKTNKVSLANIRDLRSEEYSRVVSEAEKSNKILEELENYFLETTKKSPDVFEVNKRLKKEKKKSKSKKSKKSYRDDNRSTFVMEGADEGNIESNEHNQISATEFDNVNSVKTATVEIHRDSNNFSYLSNLYTPPSSNRTAEESSPEPHTNDNTYSYIPNLNSKDNYDTLTPRSETFSETSNQGEPNVEIGNVEEVVDNVTYMEEVEFNQQEPNEPFDIQNSKDTESDLTPTRVIEDEFQTNEFFEQSDPDDQSVTDDYTIASDFSENPDVAQTCSSGLGRISKCDNVVTDDLVNELEAVINPVETVIEDACVEISNSALNKNSNILQNCDLIRVCNSQRNDRNNFNFSKTKLSLDKSHSISDEKTKNAKTLKNWNFNNDKTINSSITDNLIDEKLNRLTLKSSDSDKKEQKRRSDSFGSKEVVSAPLSMFDKFQQDQSNKLLCKPLKPALKRTKRRDSASSNESFCIFDSDKSSKSKNNTIKSPPYEDIPAKEYENHILNMNLENLELQGSTTSNLARDVSDKKRRDLKGEEKLNNVVPQFNYSEDSCTRSSIINNSASKRQCSESGNRSKKQKVNFGPTEIRLIHNEPYRLIDEDVVNQAFESMEKYSIKDDDQKLIFMEPQILIHLNNPGGLVTKYDEHVKFKNILKDLIEPKQPDNSCILKRVDYAKPLEEVSSKITDTASSATSNSPRTSPVADSSNYISSGSNTNPKCSYESFNTVLTDMVKTSTPMYNRSPPAPHIVFTSKRPRGRPRRPLTD